MNTLPDREVLNLMLGGGAVERFIVTKASWEEFLRKQSEKDLTNQSASTYIPSREAITYGLVR